MAGKGSSLCVAVAAKAVACAPLLALLATGRPASASLQVFPTRVLLTDQKRVGQVSLRHIGSGPQEYRISAVFYRMKADGGMALEAKPSAEERPALAFVRFSPRQVTLLPNIEQVIRVMSVVPSGLPQGDYRLHLHFEESPADGPGARPAADDGGGKAFTLDLEAKVALAIPVVVRHGQPKAEVGLSNLRVVSGPDRKPAFAVEIDRKGDAFAYGDFHAFFTPRGGKATPVGLAKGVSSYVDRRTASYPLAPPEGLPLSNGTLRLEFREPLEEGGKALSAVEAALTGSAQ